MSLVPIDFAEAGVDGLCTQVCRVASVAWMFIEETAFLEPDSRAARVRQQAMHLCSELASKYVSRVVGSILQICVGITCFAVDLKRKLCRACRVDNSRVKIEKAHSSVLIIGKSRWIYGVNRRQCLADPSLALKRHSSA